MVGPPQPLFHSHRAVACACGFRRGWLVALRQMTRWLQLLGADDGGWARGKINGRPRRTSPDRPPEPRSTRQQLGAGPASVSRCCDVSAERNSFACSSGANTGPSGNVESSARHRFAQVKSAPRQHQLRQVRALRLQGPGKLSRAERTAEPC